MGQAQQAPGGQVPPAMPATPQSIQPQQTGNPIMQMLGDKLLGAKADPVHSQNPAYIKGAVDRYQAEAEYHKAHGGKSMPPPGPAKQEDTGGPFMKLFHGLMSKLVQ